MKCSQMLWNIQVVGGLHEELAGVKSNYSTVLSKRQHTLISDEQLKQLKN